MRVGKKNPPLEITICHLSASLMMPSGDPQDGFFYPALTRIIDSYNLIAWFSVSLNPALLIFQLFQVLCNDITSSEVPGLMMEYLIGKEFTWLP